MGQPQSHRRWLVLGLSVLTITIAFCSLTRIDGQYLPEVPFRLPSFPHRGDATSKTPSAGGVEVVPDLQEVVSDSQKDIPVPSKPQQEDEYVPSPTQTDSSLLSACSAISSSDLSWLTNTDHGSPMSLFTFANGRRVEADQKLMAPQTICAIVAVVQKPPQKGLGQQGPVSGRGPDDIHLLLNSTDVTFTMPALLPMPNQDALQAQLATDKTILYYAELHLLDGGDYTYHAEREWANWRWALEYNFDVTTKIFHFQNGLDVPWGSDEAVYGFEPEPLLATNMFPQTLHVENAPIARARPPCTNKVTAAKGRWYKEDAVQAPSEVVDEWGYVWEGDDCAMHFYNERETIDCLADMTIHVLGDSNSRRLTKTLMTGGRWCHNITDTCQTADDIPEKGVQVLVAEGDKLVEAESERHWEKTNIPYKFGRNTTLHFSFLESVVTQQNSWVDVLYDDTDYTIPNVLEGIRIINNKARPRIPPQWQAPDLVIVGPGAWDSGYDDYFIDFENTMPRFRDTLLEAYAGVPMVLRLSQSFCCRPTAPWYRRFTGARIQQFDDLVRQAFRVDGGQALDGRVCVLDTNKLNGRPEVIFDYNPPPPAPANHLRASHVRVENQMLLNSICEWDPYTGKVAPRKLL